MAEQLIERLLGFIEPPTTMIASPGWLGRSSWWKRGRQLVAGHFRRSGSAVRSYSE